jgi:hypothetical protein
MSHRPRLALLFLLALLLAGCANQGSLVGPTVPNAVVDVSVTMAGPIDNSCYYFVALDNVNDNGATFPVPVAGGPYWGNGWGTGTITDYLEYHLGQYNLFQTQLSTALTARTGGFLSISGTALGSTAGVYQLTVLSVAGTMATVQSVFKVAATGQTSTVSGPVTSNTTAVTTVVPGLTLTTGTLAVGDTATIAVELSPNAVLITPAYFQYTLPSVGGTTLAATFDLGSITPTGTTLTNLSFNFITTNILFFDSSITKPSGWAYDGLGPIGNDAIVFNDPRQFLSWNSASSLFPPGPLQGNPSTLSPEQRNAIAIVNWTFDVRRLQ